MSSTENQAATRYIYEKLRMALKESGIPQDFAANYLGLPLQHFSAALSGKRKFTFDQVLMLADICNQSLNNMVEPDEYTVEQLKREIKKLDDEIDKCFKEVKQHNDTGETSAVVYQKVIERLTSLLHSREACRRRLLVHGLLENADTRELTGKVVAKESWPQRNIYKGSTHLYHRRLGVVDKKLRKGLLVLLENGCIVEVADVTDDVVSFRDSNGADVSVEPGKIVGVIYGIWNPLDDLL